MEIAQLAYPFIEEDLQNRYQLAYPVIEEDLQNCNLYSVVHKCGLCTVSPPVPDIHSTQTYTSC